MILLREARERKGLSQKRLSELSNVPQQTISAIENGERENPGIETLYRLTIPLHCKLDDIYKPSWKGSEQRDAG